MEEIKSSNGTIGKIFGAILILISIAFLVFAFMQEPTTSVEECTTQGEVILSNTPQVQQDDKFNF